jgi:hypothetical protein
MPCTRRRRSASRKIRHAHLTSSAPRSASPRPIARDSCWLLGRQDRHFGQRSRPAVSIRPDVRERRRHQCHYSEAFALSPRLLAEKAYNADHLRNPSRTRR